MIGQQMALDRPELVKSLILLGTGPRGGEAMTFTDLSPEEQADPFTLLLAALFAHSEASQAAGRNYIKRLESRTQDRDLPITKRSAEAQLAALKEWGAIPASGRYATLKNIAHPTLIVHGIRDTVVAPINAFILAQHLPNAQLIIYPDSAHGSLYQYPELFVRHVSTFLTGADPWVPSELTLFAPLTRARETSADSSEL